MLAQAVGPLLADETAVSDAHGFRTYLESTVGAFFDYLLGHPRLVRIPTWEMAGGWKIFAEIAEGFPSENGERFEALFREAWDAGLLRFPAHDPIFDARAGMHGPSLFFPRIPTAPAERGPFFRRVHRAGAKVPRRFHRFRNAH